MKVQQLELIQLNIRACWNWEPKRQLLIEELRETLAQMGVKPSNFNTYRLATVLGLIKNMETQDNGIRRIKRI